MSWNWGLAPLHKKANMFENLWHFVPEGKQQLVAYAEPEAT
jgi:hypothetical protein